MDNLVYYTSLYDLYSSLLTDKQKETFKSYYFDNYTLEEIACGNNISKAAAAKELKTTKELLNNYENKLHLKKRRDLIEEEFKNEKEILSRIEKYDNI